MIDWIQVGKNPFRMPVSSVWFDIGKMVWLLRVKCVNAVVHLPHYSR